MGRRLGVWRDSYRGYCLVGHVEVGDEGAAHASFAYDASYLQGASARAISHALPLTAEPYEGRLVRAWFGALAARSQAERDVAARLGTDERDHLSPLVRMGYETPGCLVIGAADVAPGAYEGYRPLDARFLTDLARKPRAVAAQTATRARQALAGESPKIALYWDEAERRWLMPVGGAPSTHLVKAPSPTRPGATVNEALCLRAAELCDVVSASATLVDVDADEPLVVVRRYDRAVARQERLVAGHPRPLRLHQEGFCQALGIPDFLRREPGGADYLGNITTCASRACDNGFGARCALLESLVFSFLMGDCGNHLQHYALLYSAGLEGCEIAPLGSPLGMGPNRDPRRTMGVALSRDRRIDSVTRADVLAAVRRAGVTRDIGESIVANLAQRLPGALEQARDHYAACGFRAARAVADDLIAGVRSRVAAIS